MKITSEKIIIALFLVGIVFILANLIVSSMAKTICEDTIEKPFRYESQGLFGKLTKIETTEQNADGYAKFCIKHGEPSFWSLSENLNYLMEHIK